MSIIYDALKKIEKKNADGGQSKKTGPSPLLLKSVLLYVLAGCAGLMIASYAFRFFEAPLKQKIPAAKDSAAVVPVQQPLPQAARSLAPETPEPDAEAPQGPQPVLILNGVFSGGKESYALVNNNIVMPNDTIEGAQVLEIGDDYVVLDFRGKKITLRVQGN
ncbi:MAG: hypothetical protein PHR11_06350 [Candidatus Omnitrophica bacterium]|nr:hypothetical protein [Candidatus Omnitrophota bacterium]